MSDIKMLHLYSCELDAPTREVTLPAPLMHQDAYADVFRIHVTRGGLDLQLGGMTVRAWLYLAATGETMLLEGSVDGSAALVTLQPECYLFPGYATLAIQLQQGADCRTLIKIDLAIKRTSTDVIIAPSNVLPTLPELLAQIAAMEQATAKANEAAASADAAREGIQGDLAALTQEIDTKVVAGIGPFVGSDGLPLVSDLNDATPNRIVATPKANYVANTPGQGTESTGTLFPFACSNSTMQNGQGQIFMTQTGNMYIRYKWAADGSWTAWEKLVTSNEIDTVVSGIGRFVTSDSLPLIEDANDVAPNTILAIAKANYVQNMPGTQGDSQGTLMHFAYANRADANCQVQMLVTPDRKVWVRNLWSTDEGWRSWVQLETKVTFYVGGNKATHTRLVDAVNDANALPDHIHVDIMVCQNVNLYVELGGEAFVQSVTETPENMQGVLLRDNVDLIGVGMPSITLLCPDDVATYKFTEEVSVLNLNANNKLSGIIFSGKNVRYVIHDEGGGKGDYNRIVENCYFYHNGTYDGGWNSGQAYGAGTGHSGAYLFDGCVFEGTKMPFSIHNNHNVQRPIIKLVNCVLKGGAGYPGARFGTYGDGYVAGNVYLNGCRSSGVIRTVTEGDYDTFNAGGFQIIPGDTVYRTDLAKLTYYTGNDVWKEI